MVAIQQFMKNSGDGDAEMCTMILGVSGTNLANHACFRSSLAPHLRVCASGKGKYYAQWPRTDGKMHE